MLHRLFKPVLLASALIAPLFVTACYDSESGLPLLEPIATDAQSIADGRQIAEAQCSNCHALDNDPKIRPEDPPPLRYILAQYNPYTLSQDFQAGIHVGHPMMPDFVFGPLGADVMLAYLVSIQQEPPEADPVPKPEPVPE
ncbi:c-type cytochrome [Hyphomonas chukchiensis]|uniref:Cytochrome c domain-containing protein n=1 Tax=Hyphomonas chukchiensis TaxID=1280947 RepID=A0A062UCW6_9PROT|nr:hypothetical protein [Hyphomonas chukchiensis]KCZ58890.1 hypothetical protein HY30_03890 [Hyphomonas chukchiensis]